MSAPLILGAGPAGCAAAITLGEAGATPTLIDRNETVGDALCGGFMSWRTAETVKRLGVDLAALGAQSVTRLRVFAGARSASADLPAAAFGLSRHAFDTALRARAIDAGARLAIDRVKGLESGRVRGEAQEWVSDSIFLATGKHDVRGQPRPRQAKDPALGIRARLPASDRQTRQIGDAIELHLFDGGYAGIVLQEDGSANICLALRKSALAEAGGSPRALLDSLAAQQPHFAERWAHAPSDLAIDSIGAVPYGYIARESDDGLYRLGDQAAVIPSLAGEGMSIAVASGVAAANAWGSGMDADQFQRAFAECATPPIKRAGHIWHAAENPQLAALAIPLLSGIPGAAGLAMRATRIAA